MEKAYIGVNFPNLVSIALMVGVIYGLYWGIKKYVPMSKMGM
jgi:hypothetical protein